MPQLLFEYAADTKVSKEKNGSIILHGVALRSGFPPNLNRRVYPKEVMEEGIQELTEKVKNGTAYATFGHYDQHDLPHEKISHYIRSLKPKGESWVAEAVLIPEGLGKIAGAIVERNGKLGFSSIAQGDVESHKDYDEVLPGAKIHRIDLVSSPSTGMFCQALKESILSEEFSPSEKEMAYELLQENNQPQTLIEQAAMVLSKNGPRNFGGGMISEESLGATALERAGLYDLADQQRQREFDNSGGIYRPREKHQGDSFPSLEVDDRSHLDRMHDLTQKFVDFLLALQNAEIPTDNTGLATHSDGGYLKTSLQPKYDDNLEGVIRNMFRQPLTRAQIERFRQQMDLNRKKLNTILKNTKKYNDGE
jgi:hypothetical protein